MKKIVSIAVLLSVSVVLLALPSSQTASVSVTWPRAYDTNFPSDVYFSGTIVYWGSTSRTYSASAFVAGTVYSNVVLNLTRGHTYYFTVTQLGTNGVESDFGNEVAYTVPNKPPKAGTSTVN